MAWKFPKFNFNFFSGLDARTRIFVLIAGVITMVFLVYVVTRLLGGGGNTTGPTSVAAPPNLQSVPGSQLTPEYYRALTQAQQQAAQQAQISAGSAVPTLINPGATGNNAGCVICADQSPNVKNLLDNWVKQGAISPDVASQLQQLADANVPVSTYAQKLQDLVKEGKLTPEQARQLLEEYKRQHANALLNKSAKGMDALISSGRLPLDVANQLLADQRNKVSPCAYEAELQQYVAAGKISKETASFLSGQYSQQRLTEITQSSIASLQAMIRDGELTQDVEQQLESLVSQMVPLDTFTSMVHTFVDQGKIAPVVAAKLITQYEQQKNQMGGSAIMAQLLQNAKASMNQEITDLVNQKRMSIDIANGIRGLMQRDVSLADFSAPINQLVKNGKLAGDVAQLKIADYTKIKGLESMTDRLANLKANNAGPDGLANELKSDVQAGLITPDQAAQLATECVISSTPTEGITPVTGDQAFAQLQQNAQITPPTTTGTTVSPADFEAAQMQAQQQVQQERATRVNALLSAMQGQAGQLISAWAPPIMQHFGDSNVHIASITTTTPAATTTTTTTTTTTPSSPVLIKAGTVLYAVLDTAVNSDYKTSPVMATIVLGPYKGAKLLGQLVTSQNPAGVLDRIGLNFTLMNMPQWPDSKTITAYAIDPDTARAVFASNVNYHYLTRYGAIAASAFLEGFANAISNSGSTQTTGIFGTSTQHIVTSTSENIWIGLGQVGTTIGNAIANYANIPPTVYVNAGVSLGILFMADVR